MFIAFDFLVVVLVLQSPPTTLDGWMDANSCSIDDRWFSKNNENLSWHNDIMSTQDTRQQRGFVLFSCGGDHMMTTTRLPCPGCCRKFAQNHLYRSFAVGDRMLSAVGARLLLLFCCFFLLKEGSWKASKSHCERTDASVHVDPVYCTCPFSFCEKCDGGHCAMGRWRMIFFSWRRLQRSCPLKGRSNLNVSLCEKIVSNLMNIQLRTSSWELRKTFFSFFFNEF